MHAPQIYDTHVRLRDVSENDVHHKLSRALQSLPWYSGAYQESRHRYVIHAVTESGRQVSMKVHVLRASASICDKSCCTCSCRGETCTSCTAKSYREAPSASASESGEQGLAHATPSSSGQPDIGKPTLSWWLNFRQRWRETHQSHTRAVFLEVYSAICMHDALLPHVDTTAVHPEYAPRYVTESHMTPACARDVSQRMQPLPPPPSHGPPQYIAVEISNDILPLLFCPLSRTYALAELVRVCKSNAVSADLQRLLGIQCMVRACVLTLAKRGEASLADMYMGWQLCGHADMLSMLIDTSRVVCASCTADTWHDVLRGGERMDGSRSASTSPTRCVVCATMTSEKVNTRDTS